MGDRNKKSVLIRVHQWFEKPNFGRRKFIYHDGALEGEDDRRKIALLKLVERLCAESGIQYIMSAIRHELPRNPDDTLFTFKEGEVIRELHDNGDDGRLFRMGVF